MLNMSNTESARLAFITLAEKCGSDAVSEENAILSIGREFLPPCALRVLDHGKYTAEYWNWLTGQTQQAQDEHDADYAAGHARSTK